MNSVDMATYNLWRFCYTRQKDLRIKCSIGQLREVCQRLEGAMPGYTFCVDRIFEGGIEFVDWPEKKSGKEYKTIRFCSSDGFPFYDDKTSDDTSFHLNRSQCVCFFLKAFYGAPAFTKKELNIFKYVFTQVVPLDNGWTLYTRIPKLRYQWPEHSSTRLDSIWH